MDIGMLWLDDSTRSVDEKVKRAVAFYTEKYGRQPTLCMVNPTTTESEGTMAGVQVRPARSVLPHHFLVGVEEERPNGKTAPAPPRPGLAADKGTGQLEMDLSVDVEATEGRPPKRRKPAMPALDSQAA